MRSFAISLLVLIFLSGCGDSRKEGWTDERVESLRSECNETNQELGELLAERLNVDQYCTCAAERFSEAFPYEEFVRADADPTAEENRALTEQAQQLAIGCLRENFTPPAENSLSQISQPDFQKVVSTFWKLTVHPIEKAPMK